MKLAILNNAIAEGAFQQNEEVPIEMSDPKKTQYSNEWRSYRERNSQLLKHRGQAFSLILGQCTQLHQDKMKQGVDWTMVSTSYNPLTLYRLIEKTILGQTEDQYPLATVYDQELAFYLFRQDSLSNPQWYKQFNTKVDVGMAIGVTRQHKVLLEYIAMELHTQSFANLGAAEQQAIREHAKERSIPYAFLRQSGTEHGNLKVDLQNDFTTGDNRYPKNRQQTLHFLDKYTKTIVPKTTQSEGTSFAQKGGRGNRNKGNTGRGNGAAAKKPFDKEYWKDKKSFNCGEKGHPSSHCPKDDVNDDNKSQAKSVKIKEDDSNISDSDALEEASHFQFADGGFQLTQVENEFKPQITKLFKQTHGTKN
jgi:hypothetical protein